MPILTLDEVESLARETLQNAGASGVQATAVARSTRLAERDGIRSHGLLYVPIYAEHLRCGKVLGTAQPIVHAPLPSRVHVDAANGFAHPAIDAGWEAFETAAHKNGIAALTLHNSYNCGVLGHHVERLAEAGLLGLGFTHAPASIAPSGGTRPVVGTNPIAMGVPSNTRGKAAFVIDQSASAIAKSEIMLRSREGHSLEPGWAFDADGNPTTDPAEALKGTMAPAGGYKGFGIGLIVEVMASALAGAVSSREASPFSGNSGGPPATGQCFIAISPGEEFAASIKSLVQAITAQKGARLPGARRAGNRKRFEAEGVEVDDALLERIRKT